MAPSKRFVELLKCMEDIHNRKNAGYAGQNNPDAFANFRMSEMFGISPFKGCLVRLSDKFIRVANLTKDANNEKVGENVIDTLIDLANYAIIAVCLFEEENGIEEVDIGNDIDLSTNTRHQFFIKRLQELGMYDKDSDYNGMLGKAIEELSATFAKQGHSGFSASITVALFDKLMDEYNNLGKIVGDSS